MSFDIAMSHPLGASAGQGGYGGPGMGGHQGPNWYIAYGMDLAAPAGTDVYAAFDAHLTKVQPPHVAATDSGSVYGAQLFMRAPNDMMGAFYTHITDVPDGLAAGSQVSRGVTFWAGSSCSAGFPRTCTWPWSRSSAVPRTAGTWVSISTTRS